MKKGRKKLVILWIEEETKNRIKEEAARQSKTMIDFIYEVFSKSGTKTIPK